MQTAVAPGEFRRYAAPGVLGMIGISHNFSLLND